MNTNIYRHMRAYTNTQTYRHMPMSFPFPCSMSFPFPLCSMCAHAHVFSIFPASMLVLGHIWCSGEP